MKVISRSGYSGYYAARFRAARPLWVWSFVLALLCTLITYPGIFYSDSYVRVSTGGAVLNAIQKTLTGRRFRLDTGNAFTVIPSFFMALSLGLTGHVGLYTFCQAFAFFAAAFLLIRSLNPVCPRLQMVLCALCPLMYGMSVYYEAGIGCVTGIVGLFLLFRHAGEEKEKTDRVIEFLLVSFCSLLTFGYRTNALTILPPLLFYLWRRVKRPDARKARALALLALCCGLLATKAIPWALDVHAESTASAGIVWEMLTAIQRMEPEKQADYLDYLDEIGGEGATRAALSQSTEATAGSFMWDEELGTGKLSAPGATLTALRKYVHLMFQEPGIFFGVKWDVCLRSLGIQGGLDASEYNYNRWNQMSQYGFNDAAPRRAFYDSYLSFVRALSLWTLHPWFSFLISLALVAFSWGRKSPLRGDYLHLLALSAFYYLAYLLDTPAYDFRYFYPSLFLLTILDGAILCSEAGRLLPALRRKRTKGGHA